MSLQHSLVQFLTNSQFQQNQFLLEIPRYRSKLLMRNFSASPTRAIQTSKVKPRIWQVNPPTPRVLELKVRLQQPMLHSLGMCVNAGGKFANHAWAWVSFFRYRMLDIVQATSPTDSVNFYSIVTMSFLVHSKHFSKEWNVL